MARPELLAALTVIDPDELAERYRDMCGELWVEQFRPRPQGAQRCHVPPDTLCRAS
ncbi:hypothetical protein [Streptomyces sp. NPDC060366]|uniref:hypothetical protein n=1 Tax=Streptomyces sp. NPDC060366 TaxID=3347105 RepID=UPI00365D39C4